jgi:hypothetical protein
VDEAAEQIAPALVRVVGIVGTVVTSLAGPEAEKVDEDGASAARPSAATRCVTGVETGDVKLRVDGVTDAATGASISTTSEREHGGSLKEIAFAGGASKKLARAKRFGAVGIHFGSALPAARA